MLLIIWSSLLTWSNKFLSWTEELPNFIPNKESILVTHQRTKLRLRVSYDLQETLARSKEKIRENISSAWTPRH